MQLTPPQKAAAVGDPTVGPGSVARGWQADRCQFRSTSGLLSLQNLQLMDITMQQTLPLPMNATFLSNTHTHTFACTLTHVRMHTQVSDAAICSVFRREKLGLEGRFK